MLKDVKYKNYCFKIVELECRMIDAYSHILYWSYYLDARKDIRLIFFGPFICLSCLFANKIIFCYYFALTFDETTGTI